MVNIEIVKTSGIGAVEVPDEAAQDFQAAYDALKDLPSNRQAVADFDTAAEARLWVKQGKTWAAAQKVPGPAGELNSLEFSRRGNVSEAPTRVAFRIYRPETETEKATRKAATEKAASEKAGK